ncbi:mucin-1-like [Penaeus indicus]|uniref:mucin-1-like n=1 Tax=Penaeus indicus TaxID=29960 RepID=UPI00300C71DA
MCQQQAASPFRFPEKYKSEYTAQFPSPKDRLLHQKTVSSTKRPFPPPIDRLLHQKTVSSTKRPSPPPKDRLLHQKTVSSTKRPFPPPKDRLLHQKTVSSTKRPSPPPKDRLLHQKTVSSTKRPSPPPKDRFLHQKTVSFTKRPFPPPNTNPPPSETTRPTRSTVEGVLVEEAVFCRRETSLKRHLGVFALPMSLLEGRTCSSLSRDTWQEERCSYRDMRILRPYSRSQGESPRPTGVLRAGHKADRIPEDTK